MNMNNELVRLDWIVLGGYMLVLLGIAWWVISKKNETSEEYFLAGRNIGWFVIGASIFASNIGSEHVVGLAGTGAESGVPLAHYELHAWIVLLLGWFFLPFYMRSNAFTMPEFFFFEWGHCDRDSHRDLYGIRRHESRRLYRGISNCIDIGRILFNYHIGPTGDWRLVRTKSYCRERTFQYVETCI